MVHGNTSFDQIDDYLRERGYTIARDTIRSTSIVLRRDTGDAWVYYAQFTSKVALINFINDYFD